MTIRLVVVAGILGILTGAFPVAPVAAASDKLPDLKVAAMSGFRIERTASGRRLLRFNGMMLNVGRGPFEIRGRRASTKKPWVIDQVIYRTGGGTRRIRTKATLRYAGDGHDHFHVRRILSYHLWSVHGTSRDVKIGFCFFDTNARNLSLAGAPRTRKYVQSSCGRRGSLRTKNGLSVGWGDLYPAKFAYQWIEVTGLPGGTYTIRAAIDLYGQFKESSETNNCKWARVSFKSSGSKVKVLASGSSCVNDHDSTPYDADIDWAYDAGVAVGCDADMFCTYDPVTRGQLASFVTRAMHLPTTDTDFFTDDRGSGHEVAINRVAAAGIFGGCTTTRFCPDGKVSRASMATILARALALPPTDTDYFTDDDGNANEASINAVAEAGIIAGCTATTFCPSVKVNRGQTMRFLHTAFGVEPPPADAPAKEAKAGSVAAVGGTLASYWLASLRNKAARSSGVTLAAMAGSGLDLPDDEAITAIPTIGSAVTGPLLQCVIDPVVPVDSS